MLSMTCLARPIEIQLRPPKAEGTCPGCDCSRFECFTPCCDCTESVTQPWAEVMLERVILRLVSALGERMRIPQKLTLRLVEPARLLDGDGVQGFYDNGVISLSSHLSRRQAVAVIAHEYGHAWQAVHHPRFDDVDNSLREGFAEWVALQALKRFGEGSGGDLLRSNQDPVYGGGLRWFLQVEKNFGREAVFEQARTWLDTRGSRLPPPPPKPAKKKEPKANDDESLPDDMSEPGERQDDRQGTPSEAPGGLRQPDTSSHQPLLVGGRNPGRQ